MSRESLLEPMKWHFRSWEETRNMALFTLSNYANVFAFLLCLGIAIYQAKSKLNEAKKLQKFSALKASNFPPITELEDFDWKTVEPIKLRPFRSKYHLTMALETLDPNDLLLMDKNYHERINHRRLIIKENPGLALGVSNDDHIRSAVEELFTFLTGTYLPLRFPMMFKLHHAAFEYGKEAVLQNLITGEIVPTRATSASTTTSTLLGILGRHLDEDFYFLLPERETVAKEDVKYLLQAYVSCCPSGFNPAEKLGKKLRDIHGPVPGYAEKLERSMDRFFSKVETLKYVKRVNWGVSLSAELFQPGLGTDHTHLGDQVEEFQGELDPEKTFLRCERQTLHRLPASKALVFAVKTYMYPIRQIKEEGLGEELAEAIDGLQAGNVPEMHFYKRGVEWGSAVKQYLRN